MQRRAFLKVSAGALALGTLNAFAGGAEQSAQLRVGLIGSGWYGKIDLLRLMQVTPVQVVSLCDVDSEMLARAGKLIASRQVSGKTPRLYGDYREMLKEKDLDVVLVGTPDHWHALPMIAAVEAGADVYVQKPISIDIAEGGAMLAAARKHKRVVQVGMQRRSTPHLVNAREKIIKPGLLGKVALVEIYCYWHMRATENPPDSQPPASLNYEMWTGPAPMRPYNKLVHPRSWRAFMEYSNGIVGDMCVHMLDMTRWMLDLGWPKRISSTGGILVDTKSKANISDTQTITFEFDDLQVIWQHRMWGESPNPDPKYQWGATLYGDKGTLKAGVFSYDYTPTDSKAHPAVHEDYLDEYPIYAEDRTEKDLEQFSAPAVRRHMQNLLAARKNRSRPVSDIEQGYISTSSCILGNLSMKLKRSLTWDPAKQQIVGDDEANALLKRPYRAPYVHPADV